MSLRNVAVLVCVLLAVGCAAEMVAPDGTGLDGGPVDGGSTIDANVDGGPVGMPCGSDGACDDGLFCSGVETCTSGHCRGGAGPCTGGDACDEARDACTSTCGATEDADGDGADSLACGGADCDDSDANRFPGNAEVCDTTAHDEDCDPSTYGFRDADGDGDPDARCCNGTTTCGTDCDDMRPTVHVSATEACNGIDDDCDTATDEAVQRTFYVDGDGDGFGDPTAATMMACFVPTGYAESNTDCNDGDRDINPSRGEVCDTADVDENCDMVANPPSLCTCTGTDSRSCAAPGACASGTENCSMGMWGACSIAPVAETCNGVDDDCNGVPDDGLRVNCFTDGDNDGYAAASAPMSSQCFTPTRPLVGGCPVGFTDVPPMGSDIDCDDGAPRISPAIAEVCNGVDDNCNAMLDEGLTVVCYTDVDNDTYPPAGALTLDSCPQPARASVGGCPSMQTNRLPMTGAIDCADNNPLRSPGTPELCNMIDDNCSGSADEGVGVLCYTDADRDTFALAGATSTLTCGGCSVGTTSRAPGVGTTDCDDTRMGVFPGAMDTCDMAMLDEDCNGTPNDPPGGCTCTVPSNQMCCAGRGTQACSSGAWAPCSVSALPEVCNSMDDDCDGMIDNGVRSTCYADTDLDGYAPSGAATMELCLPCNGNPGGWTSMAPMGTAIDCNDANVNVHPGAPDPCNGVDDDCDMVTDPGYCRIGGSCFANGVANPTQPDCQYCNTTTPSVWSNRTVGTACDDANMATCTSCDASGACATVSGGNCGDALTCTTDICNAGPSCANTLVANTCLIGGVCYANGAQNPLNTCQSCQPSVSTSAFSNRTGSCLSCSGGVAHICCGGVCRDASLSGNCGSCGTTCSRGCFQGPTNGGTCGNACSASTYRCCAGPIGTICECI